MNNQLEVIKSAFKDKKKRTQNLILLVVLLVILLISCNYIFKSDDKTNKKGETICYASTYVRSSKGNMTKLKPVIMKEEFDFIEKILSSLEEKE